MKEKRLDKEEISWILYDVANSIFILTIITSIGQSFFKSMISQGITENKATALWGTATGLGSLIIAFLAPILGTYADYQGQKKKFFIFFLALGVIMTLCLIFIEPGQWLIYLTLIVLSWVGFSGANIFYDSFIVDVTSSKKMDWVSSLGFAWGYLGSNLPFIFIVILISLKEKIPYFNGLLTYKIAFVTTAIWWLLFSIPILLNVKQKYYIQKPRYPIQETFMRLIITFREAKKHKNIFLFIIAYFFYIDGVNTIIQLAASFALDLGLKQNFINIVFLLIQILAMPFTILFARLAKSYGVKKMLYIGIMIYIMICLTSFSISFFQAEFWKMAIFCLTTFLIAFAQGGLQALSRSYYAQMIPKEKSAEFFGFYNTLGKFAAILGPFLTALITLWSGYSRYSVFALIVLFLIGFFLLSRVKINDNDVQKE